MLIEVPALMQNLDQHDYVLLYCRLTPVGKTDLGATGYLPGSRVFDVAEFSKLDFLNNPADASEFNRRLHRFGATYNSNIVAYDPMGIYAAPRVWFQLKLMGYKNVAVLNGGLPEWQRHLGKIEHQTKERPATLNESTAEKPSLAIHEVPV